MSMETEEIVSQTQLNSDHEPYIDQHFDTLEAVYEFYNAYARKVGFGIRKNSSNKSRVSGDCIWKNYVCDKNGNKVSPSNPELEAIKRRCYTRTGCLARLNVRKTDEGKWIVSNFIKDHNHTLDSPKRTIKHRSHHVSHRSLIAKSLMEQLHGSGIEPSNIAKTLNATGSDDIITPQNVIDHLRHQRKNQVGCQGVIRGIQFQISRLPTTLTVIAVLS